MSNLAPPICDEQQADGTAHQRVDDSRTECQHGLFHQGIARGNHRAYRPNRVSLRQLVNQKPKHSGRYEDAHSVVDSVHVVLDEALQSFHRYHHPV
jgi:hypothetical protein